MKNLIKFAFAFWVGYEVVTKLAPRVQAKIEAFDIDDAWEIFGNDEEWGK